MLCQMSDSSLTIAELHAAMLLNEIKSDWGVQAPVTKSCVAIRSKV